MSLPAVVRTKTISVSISPKDGVFTINQPALEDRSFSMHSKDFFTSIQGTLSQLGMATSLKSMKHKRRLCGINDYVATVNYI